MVPKDESTDSPPKKYFDDLEALARLKEGPQNLYARGAALDKVRPRPKEQDAGEMPQEMVPTSAGPDLESELARLNQGISAQVEQGKKDYRLHAAGNPETNNLYITPPNKAVSPNGQKAPDLYERAEVEIAAKPQTKPSIFKRIATKLADIVLFIPRKIVGIFLKGK